VNRQVDPVDGTDMDNTNNTNKLKTGDGVGVSNVSQIPVPPTQPAESKVANTTKPSSGASETGNAMKLWLAAMVFTRAWNFSVRDFRSIAQKQFASVYKSANNSYPYQNPFGGDDVESICDAFGELPKSYKKAIMSSMAVKRLKSIAQVPPLPLDDVTNSKIQADLDRWLSKL
jgi:hypothetical protein